MLSPDAKSGFNVVDAVRLTRMFNVSGMKPMRHVPNIMTVTPSNKGIHGDLVISIDAMDGATSSAKRVAHDPRRNMVDLNFLLVGSLRIVPDNRPVRFCSYVT